MTRLLLLSLLSLGAPASAADALTAFDAWAARYQAAPMADRAALEAEGVSLARARREPLRALMLSRPEAAAKHLHDGRGLPGRVAELLERRVDGPGRYEVLCRYGAPLEYAFATATGRWQVAPTARLGDVTVELSRARAWVLGDVALLGDARPRSHTPQASGWTVGQKTLLYIRVDFQDDPGQPISLASAQASVGQLNDFIKANSFNKTSITGTVTPVVVRVPRTKASYAQANDSSGLLADARTAARNAGYDPAPYDFDVVAFRGISTWGWAGLGYVGAKGTWLNGSFGLGVIAHEVGHNLGLNHANFWQAPGETIIGAGNSQEYGNPFDIMGGGGGHYGAWYKKRLDWLNVDGWTTVGPSGTYRLYDLEQPVIGSLQGVRVPMAATVDYWLEYRPAVDTKGVVIFWGFPNAAPSELLDMKPATPTAVDAPLPIGRTFTDPGAGIHITPVAVPGTNPPSIDVVVNRGDFSTNGAPTATLSATPSQANPGQSVTFSVVASDPDGDALAYFWDFGDGAASVNAATVTKSFASARDVLAQVMVSDMKGHLAIASTTVRVGNPQTARITGRVTDNGVGVGGVRVASGQSQTYTDSDGTYALVGIAPGSRSVTAVKADYTLSPNFTNPVTVPAGGVANIDFSAARITFVITGRVSSLGQGLPNITVIAGPYATLTNASGDYALLVPNGVYTVAVVGAAGQGFAPLGAWQNPVSVNGGAVTGVNFTELVVPVSGTITGAPGPHTVTDGVRTVQSTASGGAWVYTFPRVPPGTYNLVATAAGQRITPDFTNPVTVGGVALTDLDFTASLGVGYVVSGRVDEATVALPGTLVQATDATHAVVGVSTTDGQGRYALINLPDGDYTVTPARSGYTFDPTTRVVTVSGAPVGDVDFGVLGANRPPLIAIPPSVTPSPVTGTQAQAFVLGDDPAPGTEQELTYTWTQTFGNGQATFSLNGTNGAKSTTVTFPHAGSFGLRVTVTDPGGLSAAADLPVLVPPTPTGVTLTPASKTVDVGAEVQFVAAAADQFGDPLQGVGAEVDWAVDGDCGAITPTGRFTGTTEGACDVVATVGGLEGRATVTVVVGPIPRIVSGPTVTPAPVQGARAHGHVEAADDDGEASLVYTWSAMTPPARVSFSPNGTNAAKDTTITFTAPGSYVLAVEVKDARGNLASGFVTVQVEDGVASVAVSPGSVTVAPGGVKAFTVEGRGFAGQALAAPPCVFEATGGVIDAAGVFTAGAAEGSYVVKASCGGFEGTATVTVGAQSGAGGGEAGGEGCGCSGAGGFSPLALLAFFGLWGRVRRRASKRRVAARAGRAAFVGAAALGLGLLAGCTDAVFEAPLVQESRPGGAVESKSEALGEVVAGFPSDQERMLHVLVNQARHSAHTPNGDECGDYTDEVGADVSKPPLVYVAEANHGARFSARHMVEQGCYQNENCCVLGDAGVGLGVGCVAAGECSGPACQQTCDAGVGQTAQQRYGLFGFDTLLGTSVARGVSGAYDLWCNLMQSEGNRGLIYSDAATQFSAGRWQDSAQACNGAYWGLAFGQGAATPTRIPAASAMYTPPNPSNSAQMYFAANYYDEGGQSPRRAQVVVGGHCFDLEPTWGTEANGTWETHFPDSDVIPDGCHPYYFLFVDAAGTRVTYPDTGSLQVAVGTSVSCPVAWDAAPQLPADCETGEEQCPAGARRPCYTADTQTLRFGECRQGTQLCRNGFWGACRDMVGPFAEACDGLDNDCDGEVDEGDPGGGASCVVETELGACRAGARVCLSGRLDCVSTVTPQPEVCNGIDDDCDGAIDDGFGQVACGVGECYRLISVCVNGVEQTCEPGVPTAEINDGKDNDCDGLIDEDFDCRRPDGGFGFTRTVYPVPGNVERQPCAEGVQRCDADGGWAWVVPARIPEPEVCNGLDDDCDGFGDTARETQLLLGTDRCGVGGCTKRTSARCVGGRAQTCAPLPPSDEVCNGEDDNCDGTVDEGCGCRLGDERTCYTGPGETRGVGVCVPGKRTCVDGAYTSCTDEVTPSQEICNGLDDDCDGVVDDDCLEPEDAGVGGGAGGGGGGAEAAGGGDAAVVGGGGDGEGGGGGCGCAGVPFDAAWLGLAFVGLAARRRRR